MKPPHLLSSLALLIVLLVLLSFTATHARNPATPPVTPQLTVPPYLPLACSPAPPFLHPSRPSFSLYVLSLQWPYTVCAVLPPPPPQTCSPPPAAFTIRGLWPSSVDYGPSPTCCPAPFSLAPILDITPALRRFWPDLSARADDAALWELQWRVHGACSGLDVRTYFRKVLQLTRRYDFKRALNAAGVVASARNKHSYEIVQRAVNEAAGGFLVRLRCTQKEGELYLEAVQVCLHRTRFETVNCPERCLDGDVECCPSDQMIRIPYWRYKHLSTKDNATWVGGAHVGNTREHWLGQFAGLFVLGGGVAYWLFKQFFEDTSEQHPSRPNSSAYQQINS